MPSDSHIKSGTVVKTSKGESTRARIVEAALELFREHGYEATTMRAVAERAGVSLGNAYYYFKSKEYLLHAYYGRMHEEHRRASEPVLAKEKDLAKRLAGVLHAEIHVIEPFQRFSALLFKAAADPKSPLNPFHEESSAVRERGTALFARVFDGAKIKIPKDLKAELPDLVWIYSMGIILFWIHDDSPQQEKTHRLIDRTVEVVVRVIKLASNPLMRPLRKSTLRLLHDLRNDLTSSQEPA